MMDMSIPYEMTGRTEQKARTREALIAAARDLLEKGRSPTVEEAAGAARISRTTAYRYFPNQRALLIATFPEIAAGSLLPEHAPKDPGARLEIVVAALTNLVVEHEPALRAQLRVSLEPDGDDPPETPFRKGRAIKWIEEALAPLRSGMPEAELRRLVLAIRCVAGIEALIWLTDIAGLSREQAVESMRWSARALLRSALAEADSR